MVQQCFARGLSSSVTLPAGGPGAWAVGRPTLHGGPVWLRPVRATPCSVVSPIYTGMTVLLHDAMLAQYMPFSCVRPSVRLSQVGVLSKRLNITQTSSTATHFKCGFCTLVQLVQQLTRLQLTARWRGPWATAERIVTFSLNDTLSFGEVLFRWLICSSVLLGPWKLIVRACSSIGDWVI